MTATRTKRLTQREALARIERATRGYYYLSREGSIHAYAASALGLALTPDEARILEADRAHEREQAYEAKRKQAAVERCADCGEEGETTGHQTCQYPRNR